MIQPVSEMDPSAGNTTRPDDPSMSEKRLNTPNAITVARIVITPFLAWIILQDGLLERWTAFFVFVAAAVSDVVDGRLARSNEEVTRFGQLLDPIADKLLVAAALVSLLSIDKIAGWVVVVIIGRELAVTGLRTVAASVGIIVPASRLAKWKTVSQYVAVTMLIVEKSFGSTEFHLAATGVLWIALALTIVSAADYFYRFFRKADYRAIVPDEERWS